jgi:hypothetical protein
LTTINLSILPPRQALGIVSICISLAILFVSLLEVYLAAKIMVILFVLAAGYRLYYPFGWCNYKRIFRLRYSENVCLVDMVGQPQGIEAKINSFFHCQQFLLLNLHVKGEPHHLILTEASVGARPFRLLLGELYTNLND